MTRKIGSVNSAFIFYEKSERKTAPFPIINANNTRILIKQLNMILHFLII